METKHLARMENQSQGRGKETSETSESKMNPHHPQHAFDFLCVPLFRKLKKKCCKNYLKCHNRLKCWEMRTGLEYINRSLKAIWLSLFTIYKTFRLNYFEVTKTFFIDFSSSLIFPLLSSPTQLLDIQSVFITLCLKKVAWMNSVNSLYFILNYHMIHPICILHPCIVSNVQRVEIKN